MKTIILVFLSLAGVVFGQNAADYEKKPVQELKEKPSQSQRKTNRVVSSDPSADSIFQAVEQDKLAKQRASESQASGSTQEEDKAGEKNLAAAHMVADSLAALVDADSAALHPAEPGIFKGLVKCKGKIDVVQRVECLQYLIAHKKQSAPEVLAYLTSLHKYCTDKCEMIRAARVILPDEEKFKAMTAYRRAQDDCAKVQGLISRISLAKEVSGSR
jgi:hypothetical protein